MGKRDIMGVVTSGEGAFSLDGAAVVMVVVGEHHKLRETCNPLLVFL